ncbi:hypothetical protein L204_104228 [Cryptococcus depauperatus]|nr:hypothetical protein L204_04948 [Cryptococcus depauperatus CBS 7855]
MFSLSSPPLSAHLPLSSSPLNPFTQPVKNHLDTCHASSSSPQTSPTPFFRSIPGGAPPPLTKSQGRKQSLSTRYERPARRISASASSPIAGTSTDLFSEGTTPLEGAMWRERFTRRMQERKRRREAKDRDLNKRRGISKQSSLDEEEAERKAQEDDEEIFRRIVILQRRKARHAAIVSEEQETGGSDPDLPDFWEEELEAMQREERALLYRLEGDVVFNTTNVERYRQAETESEDDRLMREAEEAERAERAQEADFTRHIEQEDLWMTGYNLQQQVQEGDIEMDVDWNEFNMDAI